MIMKVSDSVAAYIFAVFIMAAVSEYIQGSDVMSAEEQYRDIIDRSWDSDPDFFIRHPRMSLEDRAKIFAPFAALRGHGDRLRAETGKLLRTSRIELSEEETVSLSDRLSRIQKGMDITVTYFEPDLCGEDMGYYSELSGIVRGIDPVKRAIRMESGDGSEKGSLTKTIRFEDLIAVGGEFFSDE
ncbi:MAG: YolD-like family protein [Clostridiales bacterium]|nr:YolD-like family protein [Clostridiales bacterium]